MQLTNYKKKQEILKQYLKDTANIACILQLKTASSKLNIYINSITNDRFNLVVVGNFSRGKSTFIDALMGRKILPASKKPTTAIINKVTYSDNPRFVIYYKAGHTDEISEENFFSLTAPKGANEDDFDDVKEKLEEQARLDKISYAEIGYPLEFCRNGVDLVDTPGTNDMSSIRVDITYQYLNRADAVIMVLAANQVLTAGELEFLKERILQNQIQDVFFVVNYKDAVQGEEENVMNYLKENLSKILPEEMKNNLKIYLISSYQALLFRRMSNGEKLSTKLMMKVPDDFSITGFNEFEAALGDFLAVEKGQIRLNNYGRKCAGILNEMLDVVDERIEVSKHSVDEVSEKIAVLEPIFISSRQTAEKIINDMRLSLDSHKNEITNMCIQAAGDMLNDARHAVDNYEGKINANQLRSLINQAVTECQKRFINQMSSFQSQIIRSEHMKANSEIDRVWNNLNSSYSRSFKLPSVVTTKHLSIHINDEHGISEEQGEWGAKLTGGAIGMLLAGGFLPALALGAAAAWCFGLFDDENQKIKAEVKRQLAKKIPEISEEIQGNVLEQYEEQVNSLCESIKSDINHRIDDMEHQLKLVLQEKEQKEAEQHSQLEYLNSKKRELIAISEKLQGMIQ